MNSFRSALNKHENYANNSLSQDNDIKTNAKLFFKSIIDAAREQDDDTCMQKLNDLCGEKGIATVFPHYGDSQIELHFASKQLRDEFQILFSTRLENFGLSKIYEDWQCKNENNLFVFRCNSSQSVALLGIDPRKTVDFLRGQDFLGKMEEKLRSKTVSNFLQKIPHFIQNLNYILTNLDDGGKCQIPLFKIRWTAMKNMEIALDVYLLKKDLNTIFRLNKYLYEIPGELLSSVGQTFKTAVEENSQYCKLYQSFIKSNHSQKDLICSFMDEIAESIKLILTT